MIKKENLAPPPHFEQGIIGTSPGKVRSANSTKDTCRDGQIPQVDNKIQDMDRR